MILGIDHNDDIRTGDLALKLKNLSLIDAILSQHSAFSPPATFNRNTTRTPIDALWVSPNVGVLSGGYCAFGSSQGMRSYHRQLWIQVDNSTILGKHLPLSYTPPSSRLRSDDLRSRNRYIKMAHQAYSKLGVPNTVSSLQDLLL